MSVSPERALLIRGATLVVMLVLGALVYFSLKANEGEAQYRKTLTALDALRSFRVHTEYHDDASSHVIDEEYSCPGSYYSHTVINFVGKDQSQENEAILIGKDGYHRIGTGAWATHPAANMCQYGPAALMQFDGTPWRLVAVAGKFKKGDKREINGVKCRDWNVSFRTQSDFGRFVETSYTYCVDENNFPLEIRSVDGKRFSTLKDFNQPVTIEAPYVPPPPLAEPATQTQ